MLDELCPVQFVDGMNECADLSDVDSINITSQSVVGLQYTPKVSYSLTKLEIMLAFGKPQKITQIKVDFCSDYGDKPSDIVMNSGSITPGKVYPEWREVILKPVSLIKTFRYWVVIYPNDCPTAIIAPKNGKEYPLMVNIFKRWVELPEYINGIRVMCRFYGRILPTNS